MAQITRIDVTVSTGSNGTNDNVYLGIGGREFLLDRSGRNDFRRNTNDHFVLGVPNNVDSVANANRNDPNQLVPLDTADLSEFPIYFRAEAAGAWHLTGATIKVASSGGSETITALPGAQNLFLGPDTGTFLFIKRAAGS